jgi:Fe2+ or Zn2+ uptake regulation protein
MPATRRARSVPRAPGRGPRPAISAARPVRPIPGEDPHGHIVCRICGRIQVLDLSELDLHLLTELAALAPEGWSVDRIAYSIAGACQRCREGPSAR